MGRDDSAPAGLVLRGRRDECTVLDRLLEDARAGQSAVLVVRGDAGIGKTALLEYAIAAASGMRVLRAVGVEAEMELPFAALHQACAPLVDRLDGLPGPQRDALATTFGLSAGAVPDLFFVGLAVLGLLSEAAQVRPVLCVIDDAQWFDGASAQALAFVARRMLAEPVVMVFAAREPSDLLAGLPELVLEGLGDGDARALLASVIPGRLDERVADQLLAETAGNPLALVELPRGLSAAQLAGGFALPGALSVSGRIEESFLKRLEALPEDTQRLVLVAAAEPTGDPALLWRAAARLGIARPALEPAESAALIEIDSRVRFRHPLVRSAIYRSATPEQRRRVHRPLAEATHARIDPDRRAWHMAEAAIGPDEDVAAELERGAGRAQSRGGLAAAAAFLERAAALTPERSRRAQRALAAAQTKYESRRPRRRPRTPLQLRDGRCRRPPSRPDSAASCSGRVRLTAGQRRTSTSPEGCARAGISRRESRAHDLPGSLLRSIVRRQAGPRRSRRRGRSGGTGGLTAAGACSSVRASGVWVGDPVHQGLLGRSADPQRGAESFPTRRCPAPRGGSLALVRLLGRGGSLGRRDVGRTVRATARAGEDRWSTHRRPLRPHGSERRTPRARGRARRRLAG
jgi:hypothetical protein